MDKHIFVKVLFCYKNCLYKQIDGVAMGLIRLRTNTKLISFLAHMDTD